MKLLLSAAGAVLLLCSTVEAGAAEFTLVESCADLSLDTSDAPQDASTAAATFTVMPMEYKDGESITIEISNSPQLFNVMVRTYCTSCSDPRANIGRFEKMDVDLELFDCDNITASAVTAQDYTQKQSIKMIFRPNPSVREVFLFEYSYIQDVGVWFKGLNSEVVRPWSIPKPLPVCGSNRLEFQVIVYSILFFYFIM